MHHDDMHAHGLSHHRILSHIDIGMATPFIVLLVFCTMWLWAFAVYVTVCVDVIVWGHRVPFVVFHLFSMGEHLCGA